MAPFLVPSAIAIASEFFPVLATKLGGTRGRKVAEQVIQVAATVAGTPSDANPRDIIAALKKDEAKVAELRLRLEELDQAEHQRIIDDRMDARRYQASIGARARLRGTLMLLGVVAGLVASIVAVFQSSDPGALALITTIAGALLKMLSDAFAFEFGSSAGSKEKDAHIEAIQKSLVDTAQSRRDRLEAKQDAAQAALVSGLPARPVGLSSEAGNGASEAEAATDATTTTTTVTTRITGASGRDFVSELVALSA